MPRLLAVGHVTWDELKNQQVLGGSVSYAALTARRLGWDAAVLTSAGADFDPDHHLPGVDVFLARARATTRFRNRYDEEGARRQVLVSRSDDVDLALLPDAWRNPDVLLLGPVAGELRGPMATTFQAGAVGALAQGWLRDVDEDGLVSPRVWADPGTDLAGVHVLFLSENDLPEAEAAVQDLSTKVPIVALTRGWRGATVFSREGVYQMPGLPREEVDPTGAGDVFAAAFLLRYHEADDLVEAASFAACAASCVVESVGTSSLGDRAEIESRQKRLQRMIEEGEWEE